MPQKAAGGVPAVDRELLAKRHAWKAGKNGGKTASFATFSPAQKAFALQRFTSAGLRGQNFKARPGTGKVQSCATASQPPSVLPPACPSIRLRL